METRSRSPDVFSVKRPTQRAAGKWLPTGETLPGLAGGILRVSGPRGLGTPHADLGLETDHVFYVK